MYILYYPLLEFVLFCLPERHEMMLLNLVKFEYLMPLGNGIKLTLNSLFKHALTKFNNCLLSKCFILESWSLLE